MSDSHRDWLSGPTVLLRGMPSVENPPTLAFIVPQSLVSRVKYGLDLIGKLDKCTKIQQIALKGDCETSKTGHSKNGADTWFTIPTTWIAEAASSQACQDEKVELLRLMGLEQLAHQISYHVIQHSCDQVQSKRLQNNSKLGQIVHQWLLSLPSDLSASLIDRTISSLNWSYSIYPPLLLLPSSTSAQNLWPILLNADIQPYREELFTAICKAFKVTHIALNRPIPGVCPDTSPNILRSPTNLIPLHGDFGPSLPPPAHNPTADDFEAAFWCSATQNGIYQSWAPRYTMFSRGNLSEKTRVLKLKSLTSEGLGGAGPGEISAVDLYSGIGYFAFSYVKAGIGKMLCWEINGWSVEGLRRGAEANGWKCKVADGEQQQAVRCDGLISEAEDLDIQDEHLVVFHESNEKAVRRIEKIRTEIPSIRHVNCGLLPSSSKSWETAVLLLDPVQGGWIHAHENVNPKELQSKKAEVIKLFTILANAQLSGDFIVSCEKIETVKSYGPSINHCVFDIAVLPF